MSGFSVFSVRSHCDRADPELQKTKCRVGSWMTHESGLYASPLTSALAIHWFPRRGLDEGGGEGAGLDKEASSVLMSQLNVLTAADLCRRCF